MSNELFDVVHTGYLLKDQAVKCYQHLGLSDYNMLPKKGMQLLLNPPIASGYLPMRITIAEMKSTYDKRLYKCEMLRLRKVEAMSTVAGLEAG